MYSDAYEVRIGYVFMYNTKVMAYFSMKHKIYKNNYPTHDLELVVYCLLYKYGVTISMLLM